MPQLTCFISASFNSYGDGTAAEKDSRSAFSCQRERVGEKD